MTICGTHVCFSDKLYKLKASLSGAHSRFARPQLQSFYNGNDHFCDTSKKASQRLTPHIKGEIPLYHRSEKKPLIPQPCFTNNSLFNSMFICGVSLPKTTGANILLVRTVHCSIPAKRMQCARPRTAIRSASKYGGVAFPRLRPWRWIDPCSSWDSPVKTNRQVWKSGGSLPTKNGGGFG